MDRLALRFDGGRQRAHLHVLAGSPRYLSLHLDGDLSATGGAARIASTVDLGVAGRSVHLRVPDVELLADTYQDTRAVEVRVPLFERRW